MLHVLWKKTERKKSTWIWPSCGFCRVQLLDLHFLQVATINAHTDTVSQKHGYKSGYLDFVKKTVDGLLHPRPPLLEPGILATSDLDNVQLQPKPHYPRPVPATVSKLKPYKWCPVCCWNGQYGNTWFNCEQHPHVTAPVLCVKEWCLKMYHTKVKYWTHQR